MTGPYAEQITTIYSPDYLRVKTSQRDIATCSVNFYKYKFFDLSWFLESWINENHL